MWAVYMCGSTDCFLQAMFMIEQDAIKWAEAHDTNPENYEIVFWRQPIDIDRTDTGWYI